MAAELEAVHAATAKLKEARTADDTMTAMMNVQDMATAAAGANAAGVDEERYKLIRSNLSAAASYLAPGLGGVDTTMLSAEQRAEIKRGNEAQLEQMKDVVPPDVVAALTAPVAGEVRDHVDPTSGQGSGGRHQVGAGDREAVQVDERDAVLGGAAPAVDRRSAHLQPLGHPAVVGRSMTWHGLSVMGRSRSVPRDLRRMRDAAELGDVPDLRWRTPPPPIWR